MQRKLSTAVLLALLPPIFSAQEPAQPAPQLREAWVGELEIGPMRVVMQFRILDLPDGGTQAYFDSISENRRDMRATWSLEDGALAFDVASIGATYRGAVDAATGSASGQFEQGGRKFSMSLQRQAMAYENPNRWELRPQRPQAPFPYSVEEVSFPSTAPGVTLAGTLTLPAGERPHPVVVLISGSGPQDRDETFMEHKPFLVLADYLSRRGMAVLRYDDRGTAKSTGDFGAATSADFAVDVSAAMDFLQQHAAIDPAKVGLIGHSEGGLIAPMVASSREDVAYMVLLAAPGISGQDISLSQSAAMNRAAGGTEQEIEFAKDVQEQLFDTVRAAAPNQDLRSQLAITLTEQLADLPDDLRVQVRGAFENSFSTLISPWFRFFVAYDTSEALRQVRCPVLALNGEKDIQVLAELNCPAIEAALLAAGNQDFEVVRLPGLNHLFQACETGAMSEYASIPETINPLVLERVGGWLDAR
ncbi:MAG: pimeloyl-ACP methyl ester carboxylesterase [Planctomycetota bacterium]|jgi:pimeloyl-ACP methyl ester carboxylesterase